MKVLVVYAHPSPVSFTAAVRDRVVAGLGAGSHDVTVIDLYANTSFGTGPRAGVLMTQNVATQQFDSSARAVKEAQAAEVVVFVYPTWWSGPPAILLGWLQKTLVESRRTAQNPRRWPAAGTWPKVRRIVVVTSHGSSKLVNMVEGESGKLLFQRALRTRLARPARFRWISLYGIDRTSSTIRSAHLDRVERHFAGL